MLNIRKERIEEGYNIMDRYNRSNFLKTETVDNVDEKDLTSNSINELNLQRPMNFYTIKEKDLRRIDIISQQIYGSISFVWIILKINGIADVFNDLTVGQVIRLPAKSDIEDMYLSNRKLRNN